MWIPVLLRPARAVRKGNAILNDSVERGILAAPQAPQTFQHAGLASAKQPGMSEATALSDANAEGRNRNRKKLRQLATGDVNRKAA